MDTNIEKVSGKKGVVIREDKYGIEVLTMRNGYQWSGMPMDAELIDMLEQAIVEFKRTQASPASVPEGFTMSEPAILPDGSGFGTMTEREATLLGKVERQSAALKLAREALFDMQDSYAAVHGWKDSFVIAATTAIAAIDALKGE